MADKATTTLAAHLAGHDARLEKWAKPLVDYGAEVPEDLVYLRESDADTLGIPVLQMRKIIHTVVRTPSDAKTASTVPLVSTTSSEKKGAPTSPPTPAPDALIDSKHVGGVPSAEQGSTQAVGETAERKDSTSSVAGIRGVIEGWNDDKEYYDEMYDANGKLRPAYEGIAQVVATIEEKDPSRIDEFEPKSLKAFRNDNKLYHVPRMLTQQEADTIHKGVHQRARAVQAFLRDHYSGEKSRKTQYVAEKIIPRHIVQRIVSRNQERKLQRGVARNYESMKNTWGFWYGPDIIRSPSGDFYVCEDNLGYVGGMGDLMVARNCLLESFPEFRPFVAGAKPERFYDDLAQDYRAAVRADEAIVLLTYPKWMWPDNEEKRVIKLFENRGVVPVDLPIPGFKSRSKYKLVVKEDGVYLTRNRREKRCKSPRKGGKDHKHRQSFKEKRVGMVIVDAEVYDVDPTNSTVKGKSIIEEAKYWQTSLKERHDKIMGAVHKSSRCTQY